MEEEVKLRELLTFDAIQLLDKLENSYVNEIKRVKEEERVRIIKMLRNINYHTLNNPVNPQIRDIIQKIRDDKQ
jgi:hypothetical protein